MEEVCPYSLSVSIDKSAPRWRSILFFVHISLCDNNLEVAFFCASLGWRIFLSKGERSMKKKVTEKEVGKVLGELAEQVRGELDLEFRVAQGQMWLAENDLVDTLDEKQKELYKIYCEKREAFYQVASEIYKRKF